jgi:hypothetical protein
MRLRQTVNWTPNSTLNRVSPVRRCPENLPRRFKWRVKVASQMADHQCLGPPNATKTLIISLLQGNLQYQRVGSRQQRPTILCHKSPLHATPSPIGKTVEIKKLIGKTLSRTDNFKHNGRFRFDDECVSFTNKPSVYDFFAPREQYYTPI